MKIEIAKNFEKLMLKIHEKGQVEKYKIPKNI